jgi:transcriptional regulator with XRE-family HTH domain
MNNRLKELRIKLGLNQKEFANQLEVNQTTISQYENNEEKAKNITAKSLEKLRVNFDVNIDWLFSGRGQMFLNSKKNIDTFIKGNNNQVVSAYHSKNIMINSNNSNELAEKNIIQDIVNKLNRVHDDNLLQYIDTEITALIQRIQVKKEYGSSFGG